MTHSISFPKEKIPPVEQQFKLLNLLGATDGQDHLELWVKDEDKKKAGAILEEAWVTNRQKLIGFSLAASPRWPTKNWPIESFVELAKELGTKLNARIFLLGDENALPLTAAFDRHAFPYVTNLVHKTTLQELVALIGKMDMLVTGDSAPMHIAAALGTKFIALFGPTDPKRHLPPAHNFVLFKKELPCSPCYSGKCKAKEFLCMPSIQVGEVFQAIKDELAVEKEVLMS